jgi:ATP-dependent protease ClpP protease subunit
LSSTNNQLDYYKIQRENADRGIFLTTEINWQTYESLIPQIIQLRLKSTDPICLFINSPGGRTDAAEELIRQIRTPNQDGKRCLLTTVNIGTAASAAADLLAAGDYALAYANSFVLCHGTRHTRPQITLEDVPRVAENLKADNERFALRMAGAMFRRLVFLAAIMPGDGENQKNLIKSVTTDPVSLLGKIRSNLDPDNQKLVDLALKRQGKIQALLTHIDKKFKKRKPINNSLKTDGEILKQIVDYEIKNNSFASKRILNRHLSTIQDDFLQVKDYLSGQYRKRLARVATQFGEMFFEPDEQAAYDKIPEEDKEARQTFLTEKSSPKLFPFWYLVVSLCRLLQEGEYTFSASEALWFGLVDEAIGTNLPSIRKYRESKESESSAPPFSDAPKPPTGQALTPGAN